MLGRFSESEEEKLIASSIAFLSVAAIASCAQTAATTHAPGHQDVKTRSVEAGDVQASSGRAVKSASQPKLKVLYLENEPVWQARYLRGLTRVGIEIQICFTAPSTLRTRGTPDPIALEAGVIKAFDSIIIGDVQPEYFKTRSWLVDELTTFVQSGGGIVFLARSTKMLPKKIAAIMPVTLDQQRDGEVQPHHAELNAAGRSAAFLRLEDDPAASLALWSDELAAFRSAGLPARARDGATVLATYSPAGKREPAQEEACIVERSHGKGRTLYIGFVDTWRWRMIYGARYFDRFWRQVLLRAARRL